jgi:hypothetical protein
VIFGKHDAGGTALTSAERTIWLASAVSANPTAYNAACIVTIQGYLDLPRLATAIHEVVRLGGLGDAKVMLDDSKLSWRTARAGTVATGAFDLDLEAPSLADGLSLLDHIFWNNPIGADASPLLRVHMVKIRCDLVLIMFRHHHVLLDFYANAALVRNVAALYGGETPDPLAASRRAIVSAEGAYIASDLYAEDMRYWRARLDGMTTNALWSPLQQRTFGGRFDLGISPGDLEVFRGNARALGGAPFQALLLIVYAHLSAGADQDIVFGVPFANRAPEHASMLASMSRIVPFRVNISPGTPVSVALADVRRALKADLARARFPLWENADHVFGRQAHGALPKVALNYMRAPTLNFGAATGAISKVLYGERNAETYIRCIEEADGSLSISIDSANEHQHAERLGRAMHAAIANWREDKNTTIGALLGV